MCEADRKLVAGEFWRPTHRMEPDTTARFRVPVDHLQSQITPSEHVFVLSHFGVPRIDAADWRLHFSGMLASPCALTLREVMEFPRIEIESFIKCAGFPADHRIATRNASNAKWAGARLADVMRSVGLSSDASYLWFTAPDRGTYQSWSADRYTKDLPVERASAGDVLLAYEMNGEPLTPEHGYPLRVFVPGFYGTNSVKWVCHIEAADRRAPGIFTNELYNDPTFDQNGVPTGYTNPVWGVAPEALIIQPATGSKVAAGSMEVKGWCWGEHPIAYVDLSCDGGHTWRRTTPRERHQSSWQAFVFEVELDEPGKKSLRVRATDVTGATQPANEARNAVHEVNVTIDPNLAG